MSEQALKDTGVVIPSVMSCSCLDLITLKKMSINNSDVSFYQFREICVLS